MLTNATVKAARAGARPVKIFDQRGLFLFITPAGTKSWRMKARYQRRELLLTFGHYPEISLADARARCDQVREQLRRGEDPRGSVDINVNGEVTLEAAARAWHKLQLGRWTAVHAADVLASLERDIFPLLGTRPIGAVTSPEILRALRRIEARGALETARRMRQRLSMIFAMAISEGWADEDRAAVVGRALLPPAPARRQRALLEVDELRQLLASAELAPAPATVKLASRFLALTAVRLACVRGARWQEFEDLDGPAPLWRIPAARMKLARAKKALAEHDHLVPLCPAAVTVLREARRLAVENGYDTRPGALVFPGRLAGRPIGEGAIGDLYAAAGYARRHVPHGWRASFSTVLNRHFRGDGDRAAIDRALGHAAKDKVEAAYNRDEDLDRRRRFFDAWGELLSGT